MGVDEREEPSSPGEEEEEDILDVFNFPNYFFHLELRKTKSFKHKEENVVDEHSYTATIRDNALLQPHATLGDIQPQLILLFDSLLAELHQEYDPQDLVRVFITHPEMVNTNIIVGPDYLGHINVDVIMDQIADVIRSNNFIPADGQLSINVAAIRNIKGLQRPHPITNMWEDLRRKGSIISVPNTDTLCLPRAIAVALAHWEHKQHPQDASLRKRYQTMRAKDRQVMGRRHTLTLQRRTALEYQKRAGIPFCQIGLLTDIPLYEKALQVGITVISARSGNKKVHIGHGGFLRQITLYHVQSRPSSPGHFAVITSMTGFLTRSYYCTHCDTAFSNNLKHRCRYWCNLCGSDFCLQQSEVTCTDCHAPCRSRECWARHRAGTPSKCSRMLFCPECRVCLKKPLHKHVSRSLELHICGEMYCSNCQVYYLEEDHHRCFMRATLVKSGDSVEKQRFIFYDVESALAPDGEQIPNLIVAQSICCFCQDITLVTSHSQCKHCGSRCSQCASWNLSAHTFQTPPCSPCGRRQVMFTGLDCARAFGRWLFNPQHRNTLVFAHNARGYDSYFLYHYLLENSIVPKIMFKGTKIMYCHVDHGLNITLLDSLNFLPMALAKLPKSFGLSEMKKGYFPHLYHTTDVLRHPQHLHLPHLPPLHYYDVDAMSKEKRQDLLDWYHTHRHEPFDFWKELKEYCCSDVNILLNACWRFRLLLMKCTGPTHPIDPFHYVTIASVCMGIFRSKYLPETWKVLRPSAAREDCSHERHCPCAWETVTKPHAHAPFYWSNGKEVCEEELLLKRFVSSPIALLPPHGYARRDNYSQEALQWMHWLELQYRHDGQSIHIQTGQSPQGEKGVPHRLPSGKKIVYKLDGYFVDAQGGHHALEFHGCWYHGCPLCYPRDRDDLRLYGKSMARRYSETMDKMKRLQEKGFILHTIWSCQFQREVNSNPALKNFVLHSSFPKPLHVRDAYFGGRTNAIWLYKAPDLTGQRAAYLDFCSLYPSVLKYQTYPLGHPTRITQDFLSVARTPCPGPDLCLHPTDCSGHHYSLPYFGVIKAKVLPPRHLFFPVLPLRCNGKLLFPLCTRCAQRENRRRCTCNPEQRALEGVWCTPEVQVALNVGYRILHIDEVLHWPHTEQFNRQTGRGGLFTPYINTFLRLKAQASGYPKSVQSEVDKSQYIQQYALHEGVHLEASHMEHNPGMRSIAKLALNSFYGKFGQHANITQSLFVSTPDQLFRALTDYSKTLKDFHVLSPDMLLLEFSKPSELQEIDPKTNVVMAALCSTYARLKLWNVLHGLGRRVLYHDTDSVIYTYTPQTLHPVTGDYLGQLTDELRCQNLGCTEPSCPGHWIVEFVGCGAKNYAYRLNSGEVICKVRGFSLHFSASQVINLQSMKQLLLEWTQQKQQQQQQQDSMKTYKMMVIRNKREAKVYTRIISKTYGIVYNKRVLKDDFSTLPYGYEAELPLPHPSSLPQDGRPRGWTGVPAHEEPFPHFPGGHA